MFQALTRLGIYPHMIDMRIQEFRQIVPNAHHPFYDMANENQLSIFENFILQSRQDLAHIDALC
jgi:hypothetical protein